MGDPNTTSRAVGPRPQVDVVLRARDGTPGCDVQLVDLLARMRLEGQRRGWTLHVRSYDGDRLAQLLEVVGLGDLLLDDQRQPELPEPLIADEVVEGGDPPV